MVHNASETMYASSETKDWKDWPESALVGKTQVGGVFRPWAD